MNPTVRVSPEAPARASEHAKTAADAVVSVERLTKRFAVRRPLAQAVRRPFGGPRTTALDRVNLQVRAGEIFGLLGPNGAGKTTLFKILSTLVEPDEGSATVAGFDAVRDRAQVRRVLTPVIPDERSLMWRLSARENLNLYSKLNGLRGRAARSRVEELLRLVGLADAGEKMVGQFSSGMKQRLLLARGLLARPRVLLLDEPTRSLDPVSAREFREFIREEVAGREGRTILIATHSAEEALELCDRVGILDRGRLLAVGTPDELALEVFDERYRLWTPAEAERVVALLVCHDIGQNIEIAGATEDGWNVLEMEVRGGLERAAEVVHVLVREGVAVARFEQVRPSLAELIETVVRRAAPEDLRA